MQRRLSVRGPTTDAGLLPSVDVDVVPGAGVEAVPRRECPVLPAAALTLMNWWNARFCTSRRSATNHERSYGNPLREMQANYCMSPGELLICSQ
jgi:hypothetical protein